MTPAMRAKETLTAMSRTTPQRHPVFDNPSLDAQHALLAQARTIAIVGLSPDPARPSHSVGKAMQGFGYRIVPVRPGGETILGETAVPDLAALPDDIDIVDVFRAAEHVPGIVDACIALKLPALWLQQGVVDYRAAARARGAGIFTVMDRCIYRVRLGMLPATG